MPNGKPLGDRFDMEEFWQSGVDVVEAPRPLLERRPTQPVLRGIGIGLLFSTFIMGLLFLLVERGC